MPSRNHSRPLCLKLPQSGTETKYEVKFGVCLCAYALLGYNAQNMYEVDIKVMFYSKLTRVRGLSPNECQGFG